MNEIRQRAEVDYHDFGGTRNFVSSQQRPRVSEAPPPSTPTEVELAMIRRTLESPDLVLSSGYGDTRMRLNIPENLRRFIVVPSDPELMIYPYTPLGRSQLESRIRSDNRHYFERSFITAPSSFAPTPRTSERVVEPEGTGHVNSQTFRNVTATNMRIENSTVHINGALNASGSLTFSGNHIVNQIDSNGTFISQVGPASEPVQPYTYPRI